MQSPIERLVQGAASERSATEAAFVYSLLLDDIGLSFKGTPEQLFGVIFYRGESPHAADHCYLTSRGMLEYCHAPAIAGRLHERFGDLAQPLDLFANRDRFFEHRKQTIYGRELFDLEGDDGFHRFMVLYATSPRPQPGRVKLLLPR